MSLDTPVARRSVLLGTAGIAGAAATGLLGGGSASAAGAALASGDGEKRGDGGAVAPLWKKAWANGIVYGSDLATWQMDPQYRPFFHRQSALMSFQDDLLWYVLKPTPTSPVSFRHSDRVMEFAERNGQLVLGAPGLVWDEGFGDGWTDDDLWGLNRHQAQKLLYGVIRQTVHHYRGRMAGWIVCNEVTDPEGKHGVRTEFPWYQTIGPDFIADSYHLVHEIDPHAELLINEFGFETVNKYGDRAVPRQRAMLQVLDRLLDQHVPVHGLGIQAHLNAHKFEERFHERHYLTFLKEVADRGLSIHITELDVADSGLPKNHRIRDRGVADVYRRYLDTALQEPAVKTVINFGLSDRYNSLTEDNPRNDGLPRRPLPFNQKLEPKPAYHAISSAFRQAPHRRPLWTPPKAT
jgi:endo-1,4-beta-xylanase